MQTQPQAKPQIQTQKGTKNMQQYLEELDALLKRNTGTGLYSAEDATSNTPMYLPGKVVNPGGIESNASAISAEPRQSVIPEFQMPNAAPEEVQQEPEGDVLGAQDDGGWQRPEPEQRQPQDFSVQSPSGQTSNVQGIQSLPDGGSLYSDGIVRYSDGTVRQYKDPKAYAWRSNVDGSIGYSDGTSRTLDTSASGGSGVINFFDKFNQGYRFNAGSNDLTGECAWFSQQITTLPDGNVWRIGNTIDQKKQKLQNYRNAGLGFLPGEDQAQNGNSVVFDEGTQWGHVATISEVFTGRDGKTYYRLTESNYAAPKTVTHDRVIAADDSKIVGVLKTVPRSGFTQTNYTAAPQLAGKRQLAVQNNVSATGEQERSTEDTPEDVQLQSTPPMTRRDQQPANMSVDPRSLESRQTAQQSQQPQQSTDTQQFSSYGSPQYSMIDDRSSAASPNSGYNPGQALSKFGQEVKQLPQRAAQAIDTANPTGEFDLGGTEGLITPEAAAARKDTALKFAQPSENRSFLGKFRQSVGNATEQAGDMLGIPDTGISEILAGGKTRQTNQAFASELDQAAKQNEPVGQSLNLKQGAENVVKQAGQGIKDLGQSGVDALGAVFRPKQEEPKRAVGDVAGTADSGNPSQFSSLMDGAPSMSTMAKGDVSDPFFKMGGAEMYKSFLLPNAKDNFGGALNMDMFTPDFYKDLGNISSVFGGSKDLGAATEKYVANERSKYPPMSRMNFEEGYDRGEVDNYNRQVDEYNNSINKYLNEVRSSTAGAKSIFTPTQSLNKNIFAKPAAAMSMSQSSAPRMSSAPTISKPQMSMARPSSAPQMSSVSRSAPQMSMAPRSSAPAPSQNFTPAKANMTSAATGRPAVAPKVAPKAAPAPAKLAPMSYAKPMSVAPKPAPQQSKAPAPQSKPSSNVFSKVTNAIKNVFRR